MPTTEPPKLSQQIREARERAGISQETLAGMIGMSVSGYRLLERVREPSAKRCRQIAVALGLPEDYFLEGGDSMLNRRLRGIEEQLGKMASHLESLATTCQGGRRG